MKTKLLFLISQITLLSCQSPVADTEKQENRFSEVSIDSTQVEESVTDLQSSAEEENSEYLDWQSVRINGKLPLIASVKQIEALMGKADSVVTIDWDNTCSSRYRSSDSKDAYYGGYEFEQFGDSLDFQGVDFRKGEDVFLQVNNLKLSGATT
ncbi:hypothetical protein [uncultured Pontibacter sp.]|uniref:hypothetical protein n=1 Tax=uncultured Pontibacter sp. TaxID=453356 RepID=UPI00262BC437|nr:hypothetical protein [uncultured Pontibacter sp.]